MSQNPTKEIFIFSTARSGSTLMRYIMDTHSKICSPSELSLGNLCSSLYTTIHGISGQDVVGKELAVISEIRRITSGLMESYANSKKKPIWCEKSPQNIVHANLLMRVFPNAKNICLYRNCLDVVHSCLESFRYGFPNPLGNKGAMKGIEDYVREKPDNIIEAVVNWWVDRTSKIIEFEAQNAERCFRIKYESMVFDPVGTLRPLFEFIGVEWEANLVETIFAIEHDEGIGGDKKVRFSKKIEKGFVGKGLALPQGYIKEIPSATLAKINKIGEELNYPLINSGWEPLPGPDAYRPSKIESKEDSKPVITSAKEIFEVHMPNQLSSKSDLIEKKLKSLNLSKASLKCVVTGKDEGVWTIHLSPPNHQIIAGDSNANCTFTIASNDLIDIVNGKINPMTAVTEGKLRVNGNYGLALNIGPVLF
jgi:putative sterol carrier protein